MPYAIVYNGGRKEGIKMIDKDKRVLGVSLIVKPPFWKIEKCFFSGETWNERLGKPFEDLDEDVQQAVTRIAKKVMKEGPLPQFNDSYAHRVYYVFDNVGEPLTDEQRKQQ
jgi:hypothetical protein